MLNRINHPLLAILSLAAFLWLAWYSYPHADYTTEQVESVNQLIERQLAPPVRTKHSMTQAQRNRAMVYLWEDAR